MENKYNSLINSDSFKERAKLERFFLRKAADTLESRDQEAALEVAAEFDRFKKEADDEFYQVFFDVLGAVIKRKYLDRDEDFALTSLDEHF